MIRQIQDIKDKRNTVYIVKNIIEHPIFKKDNYANCKNCHEKDILIVELIDRLFELDTDKNDRLADYGERDKYGKIRNRLKKELEDEK